MLEMQITPTLCFGEAHDPVVRENCGECSKALACASHTKVRIEARLSAVLSARRASSDTLLRLGYPRSICESVGR